MPSAPESALPAAASIPPGPRAPAGIRPRVHFGLSARLLWLTIVFVMVAEVLIWAPSISNYRKSWLEERITRAYLATIAYAALPDDAPLRALGQELLANTGLHGIGLTRDGRRSLMVVDDMPPAVDVVVDLREGMFVRWIGEAFDALWGEGSRVLRVLGHPEGAPDALIEIVLDEGPLRAGMIAFSARILTLSIAISLFAAGLVYLSLQWLMVRPMRRITEDVVAFRVDPEGAIPPPADMDRGDEIGIASREFAAMQADLRAALRQKTRLATLGAAVAKVNHDLRNTLATAMLASDRLADSDDPEVRKVAPRLYDAMQRAVSLCSRTLNFVSDVRPALQLEAVPIRALVEEVASELTGKFDSARIAAEAETGFAVAADREQLRRALANLILNALQAGARTVRIAAGAAQGWARIRIADDGGGFSPGAKERLFQPFVGSGRREGTGLGLPIARDIARAHGGDLALIETGPQGTVFDLTLPAPEA
ncbi:MAG: HAMP domain-containing histidine kinase [Rhodospirillales bacterium]|nr:HAMP domain-containing histidine kinase [Rhodospirillales bacterium]